jgi:anthraniloyl-CoA monooxygenase
VKVRILGAGPGGLYLAVLLKKADPSHDVAVVERNAPDATFGWGVVFSEGTLGALRDADPETHLEISDTFARWPTVDIRYRGRLLRSRGHAFSAIARKLLLQILQRRALHLGADLRFNSETTEVAELAADADLVVGADGVNSVVRSTYATEFGSRVAPQGCKYVWFGTDLVLDAFTFIFKQSNAGLVQVHAYPFDERTSTWIVECPEPTWRRLGFDAMDEVDSLAASEALFEDELEGHRLLSNRSLWTSFLLVRNDTWHHGNVVLLGDAAHTAHFSIGSGTKLAMEDAIALSQAFVRHPGDLEHALVDYELERQPVVERFQQAAGESAAYFARVERYAHMDPMPFAFNLLTRSGRITHANLVQRDPDFVRVLDAWFRGGGELRPGAVAPPPMFAPWRAGAVELRNRVVRADADPDRLPELARGGAGLVVAGPVAATLEGRISPDTPTLHDDESAAAWAALVDDVHAGGGGGGVWFVPRGQ